LSTLLKIKVVFGHKNTANKQPPKKLLFRGKKTKSRLKTKKGYDHHRIQVAWTSSY